MSALKIAAWACLFAFSGNLCRADVSQLKAFFQSIAAEEDDSRLGLNQPDLGPMAKIIQAATEDEIRSVLPLAKQCLHSPKFNVRGICLDLVFIISRRLADSSKLLEPYIEDLALLLDDSDQGMRNGAIYILGNTNPAPSPKALAYLEVHLNDKNNAAQAAGMIAGALLRSRNTSAVTKVLLLAEQRPELKTDVIQMLGLYGITTDDALKLIHTGFQDSRADARRVTVDAVERLPQDVRKGFQQDLLRLMQDPDEDPRVSQRARQVLLQ